MKTINQLQAVFSSCISQRGTLHRSLEAIALLAATSLFEAPLIAQEGHRLKINNYPFWEKSFSHNDIEIRITEIIANKIFSSNEKSSGRAHIKLHLENKSSSFKLFSPYAFCIVDRHGYQINPMLELNYINDLTPIIFRIAPHAKYQAHYVLTDKLKFPAKLYIGDLQVAELIEN